MTEYQETPDYIKAVFFVNEIHALANMSRRRFGAFLNHTQKSITILSVKESVEKMRAYCEDYLELLNEYVIDI
jgi:hypothetical protein